MDTSISNTARTKQVPKRKEHKYFLAHSLLSSALLLKEMLRQKLFPTELRDMVWNLHTSSYHRVPRQVSSEAVESLNRTQQKNTFSRVLTLYLAIWQSVRLICVWRMQPELHFDIIDGEIMICILLNSNCLCTFSPAWTNKEGAIKKFVSFYSSLATRWVAAKIKAFSHVKSTVFILVRIEVKWDWLWYAFMLSVALSEILSRQLLCKFYEI